MQVERDLRLTWLEVETIAAIAAKHSEEPHRREGQRRLAPELTALVHGEQAARAAARASDVLFGGDPAGLDRETLGMLAVELETTEVTQTELSDGLDPADTFVRTGLARSKGEVRKNAGGFRVNGQACDLTTSLDPDALLDGAAVLVSRGKRQHHLVVLEGAIPVA